MNFNQPRAHSGQFKPKWRKTKIAAALLFTGTIIAAIYGDIWTSKELEAVNIIPIAHADITMEAKVDALKETILDRLAKCESGGKKEEDGITILDTNGVGSYGVFQFQKTTVMHFYEMMTGNKVNGRDAIILAMTPDKARNLARFVIFETPNGVAKDWVNCNRKLDLQTEVNILNKLTK